MNIEFIENYELGFINTREIELWLTETINNENLIVGNLTFVFMSDDELLDYNIKFLDHNFYTDVITFDYSFGNEVGGDILISVDRIKDNAKELSKAYNEEILRVVVHGVLHLCGYKDKSEVDIKIMREKENYYLEKVGFDVFVSRETFK